MVSPARPCRANRTALADAAPRHGATARNQGRASRSPTPGSSRSRSRPIERGTIVIRDGIIENVGANVSVPSGAQVIDAAGADVYPGFINAATTIGLADPGAGGFDDADEVLDFNPQLRPQVAFHNDSEAIPVARANGVTTVVAHARRRAARRPGGGHGSRRLHLGREHGCDRRSASRSSSRASAAAAAVAAAARRRRIASYDDLKKERDAQLDRVARVFDEARAYAKAAGARLAARPGARVAGAGRREAAAAHHARSTTSRRSAMRWRLPIASASGSSSAAPGSEASDGGIAAQGEEHPGDRLGPVLMLPSAAGSCRIRPAMRRQASWSRRASRSRSPCRATRPTRASCRTTRRSRSHGVSRATRRSRRLTINAAEILGVADRIGSIEPGKIANLFVAKGDPLEVRTVDHARRHRRTRRAARQQATGALRALRQTAVADPRMSSGVPPRQRREPPEADQRLQEVLHEHYETLVRRSRRRARPAVRAARRRARRLSRSAARGS